MITLLLNKLASVASRIGDWVGDEAAQEASYASRHPGGESRRINNELRRERDEAIALGKVHLDELRKTRAERDAAIALLREAPIYMNDDPACGMCACWFTSNGVRWNRRRIALLAPAPATHAEMQPDARAEKPEPRVSTKCAHCNSLIGEQHMPACPAGPGRVKVADRHALNCRGWSLEQGCGAWMDERDCSCGASAKASEP